MLHSHCSSRPAERLWLRARTEPWDHSASHVTGQLAPASLLPFQSASDQIFDLMASFSKPRLDKL